MPIIHVDEFLRENLPTILAEQASLSCLFTTYREVRGFRAGKVAVGDKPGLSIEVSPGGSIGTGAMLAAMLLDPEPGRAEARRQLQGAIGASDLPTDDEHFLLVTYAGLNAFDETIAFAGRVRQQRPSATIVVVTCNCDLRGKSKKLQPHLVNGTINCATQGPGCGGRDEMAAILKGIIAQWPSAAMR